MLKHRVLRVDNRLKSIPLLAVGIPRFCSSTLMSMDRNMPVFENIEISESKVRRWNMYYQCKTDYNNITSNIRSLELLNKNWVRIPTLNMGSAYNFDFPQLNVSEFYYGQAVRGKLGLGDKLGCRNDEEEVTSQGLTFEAEETFKIDGTPAGLDRESIDKDISLEDERMGSLFRKGYGRTADIGGVLSTDQFDTEANANKRFYEYIDGLSDGTNMQVHENKSKFEDVNKDLGNGRKDVIKAKGGRLIPPETPESAQISELEDLEPPVGVFNLNELNTDKAQSETTKFEVSVSVGKTESFDREAESEPKEEEQATINKRKDNTKSVLRKLTNTKEASNTELIEPVMAPVALI